MAKGSNKSLSKGRLGVVGIVFFVVAASAPLVGMTGAVPVAMLLGNGAATPGAYLAVGLTLLVFSVEHFLLLLEKDSGLKPELHLPMHRLLGTSQFN